MPELPPASLPSPVPVPTPLAKHGESRVERQARRDELAREHARVHAAKVQEREERAKLSREQGAARRGEAAADLQAWFVALGVGADAFPVDVYDALREPVRLAQFKLAYGGNPSPSALRSLLSLQPAVHQVLVERQVARDTQERQRLDEKQRWEQTLVTQEEAAEQLFLSRAEFEEWATLARIPPAVRKSTSKWSSEHGQARYDPVALSSITAEQVESWRHEDLARMGPGTRASRERSNEKFRARRDLSAALGLLLVTHDCKLLDDGEPNLTWTKEVALPVAVALPAESLQWTARVQLEVSAVHPRSAAEVPALSARLGTMFSAAAQGKIAEQLSTGVSNMLAEYWGALSTDQRRELQQVLQGVLEKGVSQADLRAGVKGMLAGSTGQLLRRIEESRAQELLKLKDYPQAFPLARAIKRQVHFKLGPTNSGKTHEALEALKNAYSGVYLAPLRLLAMEIRDRLVAQGVPCNLLTGEEHDIIEGARHTACTVEMMNPEHEVEVAVIDEIQMLKDEQRGWAWTSALVGVPGRDVYICGADTVHQSCVEVLDAVGEVHDTTYLDRKTPLVIESQAVAAGRGARKAGGRGLKAGDAVIAFSRKDVLTLSARYREQGFTVATLYGALAPEVRRTESERFASGEAEIVVATDVIGLGLNLPVERVVFSTVHKFDGVQVRPLNPTEVRQIGGRAGRFGMHPKGLVSVLDAEDLPHVRKMLAQDVPNVKILLSIAPSPWHIEALAQLLGAQQIGPLLTYFATRIAAQSSLFETASLDDQIALAQVVDRLGSRLSLNDKFTFSCAPVTCDKENELGYFEKCLRAYASASKLRLPVAGAWLGQGNPGYLEDAEHLSKDLSLYAWLGFKYPEVFYEFEALPELRAQVSRYIELELLRQGGFGLTSKEAFQGRRRD